MAGPYEEFQLDERDRQHALVPGYPVWWTRKWIQPYTLDDDKARRLIEESSLGVFAWVTSRHEPVTGLLDYVFMDGRIHITSTSNRAKYRAWSRNPATCVCIVNRSNDQESVNVRGRMEIVHDRALLSRFIRALLASRMRMTFDEVPDGVFESQFRTFDAPDRAVIRLHIDKVLTYDGAKLRRAEAQGLDLWGVAEAASPP